MFYGVKSLVSLDLSNYNFSISSSYVNYIFYDCNSLKSLNLSNIIILSEQKFKKYFEKVLYKLEFLDLSNFNFDYLPYYKGMLIFLI